MRIIRALGALPFVSPEIGATMGFLALLAILAVL